MIGIMHIHTASLMFKDLIEREMEKCVAIKMFVEGSQKKIISKNPIYKKYSMESVGSKYSTISEISHLSGQSDPDAPTFVLVKGCLRCSEQHCNYEGLLSLSNCCACVHFAEK